MEKEKKNETFTIQILKSEMIGLNEVMPTEDENLLRIRLEEKYKGAVSFVKTVIYTPVLTKNGG
jgi:hypothetical protein